MTHTNTAQYITCGVENKSAMGHFSSNGPYSLLICSLICPVHTQLVLYLSHPVHAQFTSVTYHLQMALGWEQGKFLTYHISVCYS